MAAPSSPWRAVALQVSDRKLHPLTPPCSWQHHLACGRLWHYKFLIANYSCEHRLARGATILHATSCGTASVCSQATSAITILLVATPSCPRQAVALQVSDRKPPAQSPTCLWQHHLARGKLWHCRFLITNYSRDHHLARGSITLPVAIWGTAGF